MYTPGGSTDTRKVPECGMLPGFFQVPPDCGEQPSARNRLVDPLFVHKVSAPLQPAFAAGFTMTVTVAVAAGQGDVPGTEYV